MAFSHTLFMLSHVWHMRKQQVRCVCHLLHFLIGLPPTRDAKNKCKSVERVSNRLQFMRCAVFSFSFLVVFLFFFLCCCALSCALLHDFLSTLCCCCSLLPSLLGLTQILSVAARRKTLPKVLIWLRTFNVAQLAGWQQTAAGRFSLIVQFSVSCLFWAAAVAPLPPNPSSHLLLLLPSHMCKNLWCKN